MSELYALYGPAVLTLVFTALGGVLTRLILAKIASSTARDIILRAVDEVYSAVVEVSQTYVDEIKKAKEDGKLTKEEKAHAMREALSVARQNIGAKGLKRLARVLGLGDTDSWLTTRAEAAVASLVKTDSPPKL